MTTHYEIITTSPDQATRANYARSDAEARRRDQSARIVRSLTGLGYWSHSNPEVLSELADELAVALLHIVKSADSTYNVGFLIEGIEQKMFTPPKPEDYKSASGIIRLRVARFEQRMTWTLMEDVLTPDFEPYRAGEDEHEDNEFDGYLPETIRLFNSVRHEHDAQALREFGAAIASHSWRHDPKELGLGSPLMVATIAYLRAFEPPRDPANASSSAPGHSYEV